MSGSQEIKPPDPPVSIYIERPPIEDYCYLKCQEPGGLVVIKAPQKMGKTLLIDKTLKRLSRENSNYKTIKLSFRELDFPAQSQPSLKYLLQWLCMKVGREINPESKVHNIWTELQPVKTNCTSYFEDHILPQISQDNSLIILALDDVDQLFSHEVIIKNFSELLRSWHEKKNEVWSRLSMILAFSTTPYYRLPEGSPFTNVATIRELRKLNPEEIQNFAKFHQIEWEINDQVSRVEDLTGGHPHPIKLALEEIKYQNSSLEEILSLAHTQQGIYRSYLNNMLICLRQDENLKRAYHTLVESRQSISSVSLDIQTASKLHGMGLIKFEGNEIISSCRLYQLYFSQHLNLQ